MTVGFISLLINVAVASLLVAVIIYCRRLSRSIQVLRNSKNEMASLFAQFDDSIARAAESVEELQNATGTTDNLLDERLQKANLIADDLSFMIERGNKLADRLEGKLKDGRTVAPAVGGSDEPEAEAAEKSEAELEALAQKAISHQAVADLGKKPEKTGTEARRASIGAVLEQMANRNNPPQKTKDKKPNSRIRSKAEQELFDSLKSGR